MPCIFLVTVDQIYKSSMAFVLSMPYFFIVWISTQKKIIIKSTTKSLIRNTKIHTRISCSHDKYSNKTVTQEFPLAVHSDLCFEHDSLFFGWNCLLCLTCYLGKTVYATKVNFISTDTIKHRKCFWRRCHTHTQIHNSSNWKYTQQTYNAYDKRGVKPKAKNKTS